MRSLADEVPFDIPDSWEWVRLKDVAFTNGGFAFKSANFVDEGIRVIRISDFNENGFVDTKIVRYPYNDSLDPFLLNEKYILLCMTGGTVGKSYFVTSLKEKMVTNQRVATIKIFGASEEYVNLVILSPITQKVINDSKNSTNDNTLTNCDAIDGELAALDEELSVIAGMMRKCIDENARSALDQGNYLERYSSLAKRHETTYAKYRSLEAQREERLNQASQIGGFLFELMERVEPLEKFDDRLWLVTIDKVIAYPDGHLGFKFQNGMEISG